MMIRKMALILLLPFCVQAKCVANDKWNTPDKVEHFAAGALISGYVGAQTESPMRGFWWGMGAGAAKEAIDSTGLGTCSLQDFAATAAGAAFGAAGVKWFILPARKGVLVGFAQEF